MPFELDEKNAKIFSEKWRIEYENTISVFPVFKMEMDFLFYGFFCVVSSLCLTTVETIVIVSGTAFSSNGRTNLPSIISFLSIAPHHDDTVSLSHSIMSFFKFSLLWTSIVKQATSPCHRRVKCMQTHRQIGAPFEIVFFTLKCDCQIFISVYGMYVEHRNKKRTNINSEPFLLKNGFLSLHSHWSGRNYESRVVSDVFLCTFTGTIWTH